jgi:hypothetical protein
LFIAQWQLSLQLQCRLGSCQYQSTNAPYVSLTRTMEGSLGTFQKQHSFGHRTELNCTVRHYFRLQSVNLNYVYRSSSYHTPNIFRLHHKRGKVRINVTLRRVRLTNAALEKHKYYIFSVYVYSLEYPASNARTPYYIVCGLSGPAILFHIIPHRRFDFLEKVMKHKICILIFSTCSRRYS